MISKPALIGSASAVFSASTALNQQARGPTVAFAPPDDGGALSIDAAISLLSEGEVTEEPAAEDVAAAEDPEQEDETVAEDEAEPAEDDTEELEASDQEAVEDDAPEDDPASEEADEDVAEEPAEPVVDPPTFWSAEEKALFAKAPPEVQKIIAARDAESNRQVSLAKEEAAKARKDAQVISEFGDKITSELERARTIFQGKWDGVDWAAWARENADEAIAAKFEFDAEQEELRRLETAQAATEAETHRQFLATEAAKLKEAGHILADPEKGKAEKQRLIAYAQSANVPAESLQWAGAAELTILHKAMRYDELQARMVANPPKPATPKKPEPAKAPAAAAPKPPGQVRPAAAAPPRKSVIQRRNADVIQRAMKSGRMDDAVAALKAIERA